jgi:hypothetical protein
MAVYIPVARVISVSLPLRRSRLPRLAYGVGLAIPKTKKTSTKGKYVPRNV